MSPVEVVTRQTARQSKQDADGQGASSAESAPAESPPAEVSAVKAAGDQTARDQEAAEEEAQEAAGCSQTVVEAEKRAVAEKPAQGVAGQQLMSIPELRRLWLTEQPGMTEAWLGEPVITQTKVHAIIVSMP